MYCVAISVQDCKFFIPPRSQLQVIKSVFHSCLLRENQMWLNTEKSRIWLAISTEWKHMTDSWVHVSHALNCYSQHCTVHLCGMESKLYSNVPQMLLTRLFLDFTQNLKQRWTHAMTIQCMFSATKKPNNSYLCQQVITQRKSTDVTNKGLKSHICESVASCKITTTILL